MLLRNSFTNEQFLLYGSRDSFIEHYHGSFKVAALPEYGDHSASSIREENSDKVLDSADFRMGINYAYHNVYTKLYPTVDIALLKNNETMILLGKKPHSDKWRFPGGFADPTDNSYEEAAKRELHEECGSIEVDKMEYVGSMRIDDWRYRKETDKIMTVLFKTNLVYGKPEPADDLESVEWFQVNELRGLMERDRLAGEHHPLFNLLLDNILSKK
jgi:bifunctional NMN adenylyltransferase/nudix hydrolase